ncbi:MAG: HlyD family efflux transporter periplasmic adaptor subunit [Christensenellales bacterium]
MKKQNISSPRKIRGIVYIVLMVFFTSVMIFDLVNLALTPEKGSNDFPNFDPSFVDRFNESGEIPEGFAPPEGRIPDGFTPPDGQIPDGFSVPEGETGEGIALPDGSTGSFPFINRQSNGGGNVFLSIVRKAWLPILIVCAIGDGICLFLYIRVRRRSADEVSRSASESEEDSDEDEETGKKRKKGNWIVPMILVIAVAVAIASLPQKNTGDEAVSVNEQVLSAAAEEGVISTVLSGTGMLAEEAAKSVRIPDSVTVTAYHVNNGDTVKAGDVLASVDQASVGVAVAELQKAIDELDTDLNEETDKNADKKITAAVNGRVKKIYAQEGQSVLDVIAEHGCLMLISLDGHMGVDLDEKGGVSVGDAVRIALSDGTEETGRVAAKENGLLTVTLSDESASCGDTVSVWKEDGTELGKGRLYIHSELKVTGYYGSVSSVPVEENSLVEEGDTLLKLDHVGQTSTYYTLLKRRQQLEAQMESLFRLYQDGVLYAEWDGVISGIPEDGTVISLSVRGKGNEMDAADSGLVNGSAVALKSSGSRIGAMNMAYRGGLESETLSHSPTGEDASKLLNYAATVVSIGEDDVQFTVSYPAVGVVDYSKLFELSGENYEYSGFYSCTGTASVYMFRNGVWETVRASELFPGEFCVITVRADEATSMDPVWIVCNRAASIEQPPDGSQEPVEPQESSEPQQPADSKTPPSGSGFVMTPAIPGTAEENSRGKEQKLYEKYSLAEKQVLCIMPQDTMSITIHVDELDILSLREELPVKITLEALKGREYTGTIIEIGRTGSKEGNNTKYNVTVSIPREENMIPGMNAAVRITTAECVAPITVPAAALVEKGAKTYVYTSYDEKKDSLNAPVEVETGVSDGMRVEILSGIEKGSDVFYRYADTLVYNFFSAIGK